MATRGPKWPRKVDDQVALLAGLGPDVDADAEALLHRGLQSKVGLVVATAAARIRRGGRADLAPALVDTFERLTGADATKRDPGCRAKLAIVEALMALELDAEALLRGALRLVQHEPVWGDTVDTAAAVRVAAAQGLLRLRVPDLSARLVDLLADPERDARVGAIQALVDSGRLEARWVLRLKARLKDPDPSVTGLCLEAVVAVDPDEGVQLVVEHLEDPVLVDHALLALGHSRQPEALPPLIEWVKARSRVDDATVGLTALVAHRSPEASAYLAERLAHGPLDEALAVVDALMPMAFDPRTAEMVQAATAERAEPALQRRVFELRSRGE